MAFLAPLFLLIYKQVIKTMLTLNNAVQKTMGNVNRYIESWKKHSSLWKVDKNGVLDKFAAKNPTNAQFEEKLAKYYKMSEEMWAQVRVGLWSVWT